MLSGTQGEAQGRESGNSGRAAADPEASCTAWESLMRGPAPRPAATEAYAHLRRLQGPSGAQPYSGLETSPGFSAISSVTTSSEAATASTSSTAPDAATSPRRCLRLKDRREPRRRPRQDRGPRPCAELSSFATIASSAISSSGDSALSAAVMSTRGRGAASCSTTTPSRQPRAWPTVLSV